MIWVLRMFEKGKLIKLFGGEGVLERVRDESVSY